MPIIINLDVVMAKRKVRLKDLAKKINITEANLSKLKTGKCKAIRLSTLNALCEELKCKPGEIIDYEEA